jgi:hypothetical protein
MSEQTSTTDIAEQGTKPLPEHAWLDRLVGNWRSEMTYRMTPDGPENLAEGTETVRNFGGLWATGESVTTMSADVTMGSIWGIGYDVSAKGYRSFWIMSMSSHLWKGIGTLSDDGNTMTIDCVGPSMGDDDGTANYRDVIEIIDENHRTLTSFGEAPDGSFTEFMKVHYYRV